LDREPDNTVDNSITPTKLVGKIRGKIIHLDLIECVDECNLTSPLAIASTMKPGRQEDAHEFLRHLLQAAQRCCLDAHGYSIFNLYEDGPCSMPILTLKIVC
jgi:hypothetical protein